MFISLKTSESFWSIISVPLPFFLSVGFFFVFCMQSLVIFVHTHTFWLYVCAHWRRLFLMSWTCRQHIWSNAMASDQAENLVFGPITMVVVTMISYISVSGANISFSSLINTTGAVLCVLFRASILPHTWSVRMGVCIFELYIIVLDQTYKNKRTRKRLQNKKLHQNTQVWPLAASNNFPFLAFC